MIEFEAPINMNGKAITNLKDPQPSDVSHAASVNFVNKKIKESEDRSIQLVQQENAFKKVMDEGLFILDDDDIHDMGNVNWDFPKINKKNSLF